MTWDETTDLLIVGTGAGGMTTAIEAHDLGLRVLLIEKAKTFGGTSAMSGGSLWVPVNAYMHKNQDSIEKAWGYLKECIGPSIDEKKVRRYLEKAPEVIERLTQHTQLQVKLAMDFCDYYPNRPGGSMGGRTLEVLPFLAKNLKEEIKALHPAHPQELLFNSVALNSEEGLKLLKGGWSALPLFLKTIWQGLWHAGRSHGHPFRLCLGNALVARLYRSVMDRQIPVWYQAKVIELIMENNQVVGAVVEKENKQVTIKAERGVVLAAGGFAKNQIMREKYLPHPTRAEWSSANAGDEGEAITLGVRIGAATQWMNEAWWMPVTLLPDESIPWVIVFEKALPGSIMVDETGKRFTNEAEPYTDVVKAMYRDRVDGVSHATSFFLIMDARCRRKYPLCKLLPGIIQPFFMVKKSYRENWIKRGKTLSDLAHQLGMPAESLQKTIDEFNQSAVNGKDPVFHRGESAYDNCYITAPHSKVCLAPLTEAPYYAIPIYPGDIGTKGGLKTDSEARVLNEKDEVIPNLYATGNCSASMMGPAYPGAGSTLGPAIVFGAIAAQDAAKKK